MAALDAEDLQIVSAHLQDAVLKVGDLQWLPHEKRFVIVMNRFAWENIGKGRARGNERRRSVVHFERVARVRTTRIRQDMPETVLSLLAITFAEADAPAGEIVLNFAGGAAICLDVECIETQLTDLGAAWKTHARPKHPVDV